MLSLNQPSRASFGEWMVAGLLSVDLAWTTLCLGGYRPETMVVSWLLTGAALVLSLAQAAWAGERPHVAGFMFLPFLAYAAGNVLWVTPTPWLGWRDWLGWTHTFAVFWVALNSLRSKSTQRLVLGVALGLGVVAVVLAAYQRFLWPSWLMLGRTQVPQFLERSSGPFGIPNSLAAMMLLLLPPVLALMWQRGASAVQRVGYGYLAVLLLFALGLTISRGAWLSLIIALVAWPLFVRERSWEFRATWAVVAFTAALITVGGLYQTVPRVKNRLDTLAREAGERSRPILWRAAWQLFRQEPLFGTGAGSYNIVFERQRPEGFRDEPQWAHNEYLNTLSDYGLAGGMLLAGGIVAAARTGRRRVRERFAAALHGWEAPEVRRAIGVGLGAFALSMWVDFHLKIPALGMLVALLGAEWVRGGDSAQPREVGTGGQLGLTATAVGVLLFVFAFAVPTYQAEASRYEGRQVIDRLAGSPNLTADRQKEMLSVASRRLAEATVIDPGNAQAWADRAYVVSLWSRLSPAKLNEFGRDAEQHARRALVLSRVTPEFWVRLGVSLDMQGKWVDAGDAFIQALTIAPHSAQIWYYQAYHLALLPSGHQIALAALETSLRLDPGYPPSLALQQSLTANP